MMNYQKRVLDSMQRIKEVMFAQQQALNQQRDYENTYKTSGEPEDDATSFHDKIEGSGGFAGADPKKRRGVRHYDSYKRMQADIGQRAAPPGRCHSCNRAETPEWRRGPDGARTLCNACGLRNILQTPLSCGLFINASNRLRQVDPQNGPQIFNRLESSAKRAEPGFAITSLFHKELWETPPTSSRQQHIPCTQSLSFVLI